MQVCQQRSHLLLGKSPGKPGHHALAMQYILPHCIVRGSNSPGQCLPRKNSVQVRRNLLQSQIVIFVAMGATAGVETLPFRFLRSECGRPMASCRTNAFARSAAKN
jgi:hypothetical protein